MVKALEVENSKLNKTMHTKTIDIKEDLEAKLQINKSKIMRLEQTLP